MLQEKQLESLVAIRRISRASVLKWSVAMVALVSIAAGGWFAWQSYSNQQLAAEASKNLARVRRGSIDVRITSTGTIRPYNQVKLSPKFSGLLKSLNVQQGQYVKNGDVVAVMDDSNLRGQYDAARAAYLSAKAAYDKALHGSRPQELADSEAQLQKARQAVHAATMAVNHTKADIKAGEAQLSRDETNAKRLTELKSQGAISDQDRLNAVTLAEVSKAQLQRTREDLKQSIDQLDQAKSDYTSAQQRFSMVKEGMRQEDVRVAEQAVLQAQGNMQYVQSQLNDTNIRAPFDGVVTQKYADNGAIVTPTTASTNNSATSSSIISLAGRLEMVAAVAESDIDNIKVGQHTAITASAYPTKVFHGTVTLIAPEAIVNQNVTSFEVHTSIDDDKDHKLMSGMNVNCDFIAGKRDNVLLIPTVAVVTKRGKTGVFVPGKNAQPEFKQVKISTTSDTDTIVSSGLKEGDSIFMALTKEQLNEQGYTEKNMFGPPGGQNKPDVPRGLKNKL